VFEDPKTIPQELIPLTIQGLVKGLELHISGTQRIIAEHEEVLKARKAKSDDMVKRLQVLLANGQSTGDRLTDLICRYRGYNTELLASYREFEVLLKGFAGQFALVSYAVQEREHGPRDGTTTVEYFRVGVLDTEELLAAKTDPFGMSRSISLPVSRYLVSRQSWLEDLGLKGRFSDNGNLREDNIFTSKDLVGPHPLESYILRDVVRFRTNIQEIVIGDEAVKAWLKKNVVLTADGFWSEMWDKFERSGPVPRDEALHI
jgi:hypothetical protein